MNIKLAENIKRLRAEKGMSQKELAIRLSVSPQAVSRWENGLAYPDIEMLPRIAELYGVSLDTLMGVGMSFSQRKHKALVQAREQLQGAHDFVGRRRICEILEELAAQGEGSFEPQFLGEALALYHDGGIGIDTVERAREYCRALLKKSSGDGRIRYLMTILSIEDAQNLERWQEFVTSDFVFSCWDDLLFWRSLSPNEKVSQEFEAAKQRVVHQSLRKLIMNLVQGRPDRRCHVGSMGFYALNPLENYRLALDIVDRYAGETGDNLPDLQAYVEIRMAAALFAAGDDEQGFAALESILSHIEDAFDLWHDTMLQGHTDEYTAQGDNLHRCLQGISFEMNRREYDRVRKDSRFIALYRCVEGMDEADKTPLMELLNCARSYGRREKTRGHEDEVLAVLTADGVSHKAVIRGFSEKRDQSGAHPDEQAFIDMLRETGDTEIRYIVCCVGEGTDLPSMFFRKKLLELNIANGEAKMLLNGAFRYINKTVNEAMPPKKKVNNMGQE